MVTAGEARAEVPGRPVQGDLGKNSMLIPCARDLPWGKRDCCLGGLSCAISTRTAGSFTARRALKRPHGDTSWLDFSALSGTLRTGLKLFASALL